MKMKLFFLIAFWAMAFTNAYKDYTGHKVITIIPKSESHIELLQNLRQRYNVDFWNAPRVLGDKVMVHLSPEMIQTVENLLQEENIEYNVAYHNLQSVIDEERQQNAPTNGSHADGFNFGKYNEYEAIVKLMKDLSTKYSNIATLETIGKSYENRPIFAMKISSGDSSNKPAILMECGMHAREWSSVAVGIWIVNKLITAYDSDPEVKSLVDKYEFNIVVDSNPDGYVYSRTKDRMWRKTRSRNSNDWYGYCPGVDGNRNFDVDFCGIGGSHQPCEEIFCGDRPFSEGESRALRDLMIQKKDRAEAYFSLHAYGQYWLFPYGYQKKLPDNYDELYRIGKIGVDALSKRYGTEYKFGSIANVISSGGSEDYAYEKQGIKIAYILELRDDDDYGFILPRKYILPMCEETFDGIKASIQAM